MPARGPPRERGNFAIIGIGASAGGLEACTKLVGALPAGSGMACILVQHLDPTHKSMMVDLLAGHTSMTVRQATEGMLIERDHLYVIPPGTYLSVADGALHLSKPQARHGARLPFDFLLHSLAEECGAYAICVILSGTGADGSLGLKAVAEKGGLVIAQEPDEAGYDGMPRSAIATGAVDLVLPVAKIPEALVTYSRRTALTHAHNGARPQGMTQDWLPEIIDLLRARTAHDFTLYKPGTLQRRIERRMAMAAIEIDDMDRYLGILRTDTSELDLLAKDLLINVTSFFRDPKVFDLLAEKIIPDLVRGRTPDQTLRIWVAGCSTGEETYSLAMLFREHIIAAKANVKLQVFASDVDPDAVASAREGIYPETIEADVSAERLARFFTKEDHSYRVSSELRTAVVFTVQDLLADPPFSRLDLVSCRNLLIYLGPEAQAKVVALFHFALREGGILLLGSSETVGNFGGHFETISKSERLYRHVGHARPGEIGLAMAAGDGVRAPVRVAPAQAPSRQSALAALCRRLVLETYAPAAVLINRKHECVYSLGPTDRYLRMAPGHPSNDLLAMAREGVRTKLRSAIQRAFQENTRVDIAADRTNRKGNALSFSIAVQPVLSEGEELLLVCFIDEPKQERRRGHSTTAGRGSAGRRTPAGTRRHENGAPGCRPQPRDFGRRAESGQRRNIVHQRGIPSDERGAVGVEGRIAVAQRGAHLAQQPDPRGARAAAYDIQRSAKCPVQHRCRNAVPRHQPQNPLFHAGHQAALQRHSERCRAAARGPELAHIRRRSSGGCPSGASHPSADRAGDRSSQRQLVHASHIALSHARQ